MCVWWRNCQCEKGTDEEGEHNGEICDTENTKFLSFLTGIKIADSGICTQRLRSDP